MNVPTGRASVPQSVIDNLDAEEIAKLHLVIDTLGATTVGEFEPDEPSILETADAVLREESASSWRALDLREHLHPDQGRGAPTLLLRSDGVGCLYEGKRNMLFGPYESGKSWVALLVALEVLRRGDNAVWIDFEDSPGSITGRLLALGATEDEILSSFRYLQPAEPLTRATEIDLRLELHGSALVVVDALNEAMAAAGLDPNANRDVAAWYATIPRLAIDAGATSLGLDHVAKDPTAQRGAVGGGHKMASIDGAAYRIDAVTPFGRGSKGVVRLRLAKDRPGHVRGLLGTGKDPTAAMVAIDATDGQALAVEVGPPGGSEGDDWRPTRLMEKISIFVEGQTEPVSTRAILAGVDGKQTYKATALEALVHGGYFARTSGPRNALLHSSERAFREGGP